jgi:hypothetical protein
MISVVKNFMLLPRTNMNLVSGLQVIEKPSIVDRMKKANSILPHVVLASTILALIYPPSFTWFTSRFFPLEQGQIDLRL